MKKEHVLLCMTFLLSAALPRCVFAGKVNGELKKYHTVSVFFTGPELSENSEETFRNYRLQVTFTHEESGVTRNVPGFFAADGNAGQSSATGGSQWQVRFRPDKVGTWKYAASFRTDDDIAGSTLASAGQPISFDGDSGSFLVTESDKSGRDFRGKGYLKKRENETFYYSFDNGEYFLKGGPGSPENFLAYYGFDNTVDYGAAGIIHRYGPHLGDYRDGDPTWQDGKGKQIIGVVNYVAEAGLNTIYFLLMNVGGDCKDVYPWTAGDTARYTYDISKLEQWNMVFEHMQNKGIHMHLFFHEQENESEIWGGSALTLKRKIYFREMIARFGHHLALTWNLGEELTCDVVNQMPNKKDIPQWCDFIAAVDPYDHPISSHSHGSLDHSFAFLLGYPNYDGATIQQGNPQRGRLYDDILEWHAKSDQAGNKWPISCDEPHDILRDEEDYWQHDNRKCWIWDNYMAGGFGTEAYGGGADDFNLEDFRVRDHWFAMHRYALEFFKNNSIPFWEMSPARNMVTGVAKSRLLCKPDQIYVIYLHDGGSPTLDLSKSSKTYDVRWFDPRHGGSLQSGSVLSVKGGGSISLGTPPNNTMSDWVCLVNLPGKYSTPAKNINVVKSEPLNVTVNAPIDSAHTMPESKLINTTGKTQDTSGRTDTLAPDVAGGNKDSGSTPPPAKKIILNPTDDACLQHDVGTNDAYLKVQAGDRISYLKFDVSGLKTTITSVKLRLTVSGDSGNGTIRIYAGTGNNWTEQNLSQANKPDKDQITASYTGAMTVGQVIELEVSGAIYDKGTHTLIVEMDAGGNDVWFSSKEGAAKPEIEIIAGATAP